MRLRKTDLTDEQIEVIVAEAIRAEASSATREAVPPSSAIVWWRAQMRARQEAAVAAERPIAVVHALAIACGVGVTLSLVGTAVVGVRNSAGWITGTYQSALSALSPLASIAAGSLSGVLLGTAMFASVVVASIAAYVVYADE